MLALQRVRLGGWITSDFVACYQALSFIKKFTLKLQINPLHIEAQTIQCCIQGFMGNASVWTGEATWT
jgi:hypothetical protein